VVVGQTEWRLAGDQIQIVDLTGATETRQLRVRTGAPGVSLQKIVAVGDRAFVLAAQGAVMWKLDLKQPHDLNENDLFKAEAPVDIAAGDRYLYVVSRAPYPYYTLNVFDGFDSPRPNIHGFFELGEQPDGFASAGDTIYVLRDGELQTYRAS
jgi:hypothetical protein